jgi:tetratricopeptide (TPR) repeat protein
MNRNVRLLLVVFFAGLPLFGQLGNPHSLPDWGRILDFPGAADSQATAGEGQHPRPGSNIVTVHSLSHKIPPKALKEMQKAQKALQHDQKDAAITHLNEAISIDPEYVAARNNLAVEYFSMSNSERGIEQLQEAIKIDPHNSTLFANLSVGYLLLHRFAEGERAARFASDLDRGSARARILLGSALLEQKKFTEEALRCFEQAFDFNPLAHLMAGRVLIALGDLKRARSEIQLYLADGNEGNRDVAASWLNSLDRYEHQIAAVLPH